MSRMKARVEFLTDVLTTAIESGTYGAFELREYQPRGAEPYAVVRFHGEDEWVRVGLDTIAHGLSVIRSAVPALFTSEYTHDTIRVLANAKTGERLYMSDGQRRNIMLADRTNHDDGDLDVIDALAIVECAVFGAVTYA